MATIESGSTSTSGSSLVQFADQGLSYQTLSGDHYQKIRQLVTTRFSQSEQFCRARYERFYRFEKLIHMVSKKKAYDWKANAFLPYAFSVAEQSAAIKWLALFLSRPYVNVKARHTELDEIAKRRESLLDWHFTSDIDLMDLGGHMLRQSERYGKSVAVVAPEWDTKVLKYRELEALPTALGPVARMSWKTRERRDYKLRAQHLDLTDFFPQPGRRRINGPAGMRYCMRTSWLVLDELRALEAANLIGPSVGGQSVEEIKDSQPQEFGEYKLRRMFLDKYDDVDHPRDLFDRPVELCEYQGAVPRELVDPQQAQMEEAEGRDPFTRLYIVANKHIVLEDVALPWDHQMKSFIEMDCVPDPHDFWGKGKIEPSEHLNYVANEIVNSRVDNVKQAVNGIFGINFDKCPPGTKRRLMSQPWGVIETYGPPNEIIARIQTGDVTASSYTEQQQIFSLIQEATAVNETLMGAPGPARTLGEHRMKMESASRRLQFELALQAEQFMGINAGISRFVMSLDRQYLPLPTYLRVVNPQSPDDLMMPVDPATLGEDDIQFTYTPAGVGEGMNIEAKRADLANMLAALQPYLPILIQQGFNVIELAKTIIKTFGHDPSRLFPPMQMQQMLQAMAPGMAAAGQPGQQQPGLPQQGGPSGQASMGTPPMMPPGGAGPMASIMQALAAGGRPQ